MLNPLTGLWGKLFGALAAIGGILLAVLAIFSKGKSAGETEVVAKSLKKEHENVEKANEVDRQVAVSKPDAVRDELRDKWTRD